MRRRPLAKSSPRVRTTVGGNMSVPSWLPVSFEKAVTGLGATASSAEIQETCASVLGRWSEPDRIFHDIHHLTAMLANVEKLINETHHRILCGLRPGTTGWFFRRRATASTRNAGVKMSCSRRARPNMS